MIVALEATRLEVFLSILQKASEISPFQAREGLADPVRLRESLEALRSLPLVIESGRFDLKTLSALIRRVRAVRRVELVVVDYIQLVQNPLRGQTRATEVAGVTSELKRLAMDLDLCVVVAAQLNKGPEDREDRIPRLRDLRESEGIGHDADAVLFLVRPDLQGQAGPPFLTLAKNRHGPRVARIPLEYDAQTNSYAAVNLRAA